MALLVLDNIFKLFVNLNFRAWFITTMMQMFLIAPIFYILIILLED